MTPKLAEIERRAIEAQSLPSFLFNVEEIRRTIEALLSQFGKGGIFDEYTVHSFDHVYEMLRSLEWLVPADTSQLLTLSYSSPELYGLFVISRGWSPDRYGEFVGESLVDALLERGSGDGTPHDDRI